MNGDLTFRRVRSDGPDLEAVLEIDRESFSSPWTRDMYAGEFLNDRAFVVVAAAPAGEVAGYCSFWLILDEIHINNVAVRASWRRRGIGRALVGQAFDLGRRGGARSATLEVRRANVEARRLYEGVGFRERGVRPRYYAAPEDDALILWAEIQEIGTSSGA